VLSNASGQASIRKKLTDDPSFLTSSTSHGKIDLLYWKQLRMKGDTELWQRNDKYSRARKRAKGAY